MSANRAVYRGPRRTTVVIEDSSSTQDDFAAAHILDRFTRYFKLLARIHAIKNITGLDYIVRGGASTGQDVRGTKEYPACHVVRVGEVNPKLKAINEPLYNALTNFVGHTQSASEEVNRWNNIGGAIDRFQSANLHLLDGINYAAGAPGAPDKEKIKNMLDAMHEIVRKYPLHTGDARNWIEAHKSGEGLDDLYYYMLYKYDQVHTGEFAKQWGKVLNDEELDRRERKMRREEKLRRREEKLRRREEELRKE